MSKIYISLIFYIFFLIQAHANNLFIKIIKESKDIEIITPNLAKINGVNIRIENCSSYPYYKTDIIQKNGNLNIYNNFLAGLKKANICFNNKRAHHEIKQKYFQLLKIILSKKEKIFRCEHLKNNSVFAVASVNPKHKKSWINDFFNLPNHPSVIFHTNTIAGNFPLDMTKKDIQEWKQILGKKFKNTTIASGFRNPSYTKIKNTKALVFHEMFHWPSNFHNLKNSLDIVKLTEFCCFESDNTMAKYKKTSCDILYDKEAWQTDQKKRIKYIKDHKLFKKFKEINLFFDQ